MKIKMSLNSFISCLFFITTYLFSSIFDVMHFPWAWCLFMPRVRQHTTYIFEIVHSASCCFIVINYLISGGDLVFSIKRRWELIVNSPLQLHKKNSLTLEQLISLDGVHWTILEWKRLYTIFLHYTAFLIVLINCLQKCGLKGKLQLVLWAAIVFKGLCIFPYVLHIIIWTLHIDPLETVKQWPCIALSPVFFWLFSWCMSFQMCCVVPALTVSSSKKMLELITQFVKLGHVCLKWKASENNI